MNRAIAAAALALVTIVAPHGASAKTAQVTIATSLLDPEFKLPSPSDLAPYEAPGTTRVSGRFNLAMNGTNARLEYGGRTVYLLPAVQWSYVWAFTLARAVSQDGMRTLPFAPWTHKYLRKTLTDAHGNFAFDNVPPGKYVLGSYVSSRIDTTHTYETDDPDTEMRDELEYNEGTGEYQHVESEETNHNYTEHQTVTSCNVEAALEAVVSVKPGDATTDVPVQIAGSYFEGDCNKRSPSR